MNNGYGGPRPPHEGSQYDHLHTNAQTNQCLQKIVSTVEMFLTAINNGIDNFLGGGAIIEAS